MALKAEIEAENKRLKAQLKKLEAAKEAALATESDPVAELSLEEQIDKLQLEQSQRHPVYMPEPRYHERRSFGPVLLVLILIAAAVFGTYAITKMLNAGPGGDDEPAPKPKTELVEQIERAVTGPKADEHSLYFSQACRGIAGRLEATYQKDEPTYDQRSEALALLGHGGEFATAVKNANLYSGLPPVIEGVVRGALEDEDGKVLAGPMTEKDKKAVVQAWHDLADAFEGASK